MVATSLVDLDATPSASLYARIRQALQPKSPINDAHASHPNEDASRTGQGSANTGEVGLVCLFCYYVPCLGGSFSIRCSRQTIHPSLPPRGFILRCAHLPYPYVVTLTVDHISENQAMLPFRSRFPGGCVVAQVAGMGRTDPGDWIRDHSVITTRICVTLCRMLFVI